MSDPGDIIRTWLRQAWVAVNTANTQLSGEQAPKTVDVDSQNSPANNDGSKKASAENSEVTSPPATVAPAPATHSASVTRLRLNIPPMPLGEYWKAVRGDATQNFVLALPVLVIFVVYVIVSTILMMFTGKLDWWHALYVTWVTIATLGNVAPPDNSGSHVLASLDVLIGLLTFGVIVWFVTQSLGQAKSEERLTIEIRQAKADGRPTTTCGSEWNS